jgi:hypothetical protein
MDGIAADQTALPTAYLVDGSLYVFRAWHSMPDEFVDADGFPTNAIRGYARFLCELLERARPEFIAVAFDAHSPVRSATRSTRPTRAIASCRHPHWSASSGNAAHSPAHWGSVC